MVHMLQPFGCCEHCNVSCCINIEIVQVSHKFFLAQIEGKRGHTHIRIKYTDDYLTRLHLKHHNIIARLGFIHIEVHKTNQQPL